MKILQNLWVIILVIVLFSCQNSVSTDTLEGEWKSTEFEQCRLVLKPDMTFVFADWSASDLSYSWEEGKYLISETDIKLTTANGEASGIIVRKGNATQIVFMDNGIEALIDNLTFVKVEESQRLYVESDPPTDTVVSSLDDEWFEAHYAMHRFILKADMSFAEVWLCGSEPNREGKYSIGQSSLTLKYNDGTTHVGKVKKDDNNIYLDLEDYGWYISVDPSEKTDMQDIN